MDMIFRGAAIYVAVWLILRLSGKRALSEMNTFDFVLLLICGEATQQALLGDDFSLTNAVFVILTLVTLDRLVSSAHVRWPRLERFMDGRPVLLVRDGRPISDAMRREHVDEQDILQEARKTHGLLSMDQIRHVVIEPSGGLSIIPKERSSAGPGGD